MNNNEIEEKFLDIFKLSKKETFETRFFKVSKRVLIDKINSKTIVYEQSEEWEKWFKNKYLILYPYKNRIFRPIITDELLIDLICLILNELFFDGAENINKNILKEKILKLLILSKKNVKSKVKKIFKKGNY